MPPRPIPPREAIGDTLVGALLREPDGDLLLIGTDIPGEVLARGELTVRYGLRYLGKPQFSIVPGLVAIDYGTLLTGQAAWDFLLTRSNLYPRAEVFGNRSDGRDEMVYVKHLDLAQPPQVMVYTKPDAALPTAFPIAVIASPNNTPVGVLPERLTAILPVFPTIAAWRLRKQA